MVSFKLFAGTNVGLRENNEDNFAVCPDLNKTEWIVPADNQQYIDLGSRGCVMVVADGMGGQNAGEVASAIAIDTVRKMFSPKHLSADVLDKSDAIQPFMKKVISECDIQIKKRAEEDSSTFGMGSTIVIAWLIGCKLYVAWLGDSRAYAYLKGKGIKRLSKDHSYVQQLVDKGVLTEEEAMDHPNSNIITRSLGDNSQKAKADVAVFDIEDGQIVLLCSDGLCGVCTDKNIESILDEDLNLQICKERLTTAALAAGGSDNITIALMQIRKDSNEAADISNAGRQSKIKTPLMLTSICLLIALFIIGVSIVKPNGNVTPCVKILIDNDTLSSQGSTPYHILVVGDSLSKLFYDNTLIDVNEKDSIITVKKLPSLYDDTTTYIKAICKHNPSLNDSARLVIRKSLELPKKKAPRDERNKLDKPRKVSETLDESSSQTPVEHMVDANKITPSSGEKPNSLQKIKK